MIGRHGGMISVLLILANDQRTAMRDRAHQSLHGRDRAHLRPDRPGWLIENDGAAMAPSKAVFEKL